MSRIHVKTLGALLFAVLFAVPARGQQDLPPAAPPAKPASGGTVTFIGRGNGPVKVIDEHGRLQRLDTSGYAIRPDSVITPPADEVPGEEEPAEPEQPAVEPGAEAPPGEEPRPRMEVIRQLAEQGLTEVSVPRLPGTAAPSAGGTGYDSLTEEEKRIYRQIQNDLVRASRPTLPSAIGGESKVEIQPLDNLTEEEQRIRQEITQGLINRVVPQLPKNVQDRASRSQSVDNDAADIKVVLPPHLLQQPPAQLPESTQERKERRQQFGVPDDE